MAKKPLHQQPATETYGAPVAPSWPQSKVEFWCYLNKWAGGPGPAEHFIRGSKLIWPKVQWDYTDPDTGVVIPNHWMRRIVEEACSEENVVKVGNTVARFLVLSGVGAAGKTFTCACFAIAWWAIAPTRSIVVLTSTTKEMIGRRVWPVISMLHGQMRVPVGELVDSRRIICAVDAKGKRNEKTSISAIAVAHGETQKAAHNLRGLHEERILVIVDEANGTPDAIFEAIPNWAKACQDLTVILIGNPISHLDPHGLAMEPQDPGTSPHDYRWRTKRIPRWDFGPGVCLRFDGRDSPNVLAGRTIFPYIYTFEDWQKASGLNENTLAFWSQHRGLHPPEGLLAAVLNETALVNAQVDELLVFSSSTSQCAFLDPAFGGDAAIAVFGVVGKLPDGRFGLQIKERVEIPILVAGDTPIDEPDIQVAKAFASLCKERGVQPENSGIDATGTGRGVYAFLTVLWSSEVLRFEASASPPPVPVLDGDPKPADQLYLNAVTSSWVFSASLVRCGQLKGLSQQAKVEFTTRVFHDKLIRGLRRLEDKSEFKSRYGHSPDDADAVAGLCEVARTRLELSLAGLAVTRGPEDLPRAYRDLNRAWSAAISEPGEVEEMSQETDPVHDF